MPLDRSRRPWRSRSSPVRRQRPALASEDPGHGRRSSPTRAVSKRWTVPRLRGDPDRRRLEARRPAALAAEIPDPGRLRRGCRPAPALKEAIRAVRPIETVKIYSPTRSKVEAMIRDLADPSVRFLAAGSPTEALEGADIVCATSTSRVPIFDDRDIAPGVHINAVGSYKPEVAELPPETVARARVVVDSREAAWIEAGDLIQPLRSGLIREEHVRAELGEVVLGTRPGRSSDQEITFFKSVGIAVQDAFAARLALANARRQNLGREIDW
ncbi:MAG: hypothetical protein U0790_21615 [Isosphaeraceae bacterium]